MELITSNLTDGILTVYPHGRIDANNAQEAKDAIMSIIKANTFSEVILDVDDLEYISSAGLRVILALKKEQNTLRIINASSEIYDIFEMTGFSEIIPVEKAFRKLSVEGCEIIGKGAKGTVYRYNNDTIVKVFMSNDCLPEIKNERELARKAFVLGIPTAIPYDIVKVGDKYGSVFELLDAKSYSKLIASDPDNIEKYVTSFATLLKQIHKTPVKKEDMPDAKATPLHWMSRIGKYLDKADSEKITSMINALPDTLNMIHGDFHTNNIMMQKGETILIDMDTLSHGHPIIELANVYATYVGFLEIDSDNVRQFLGFDNNYATKVWEIFMSVYFETTDSERLKEYESKIRLLTLLRMLNHTDKHIKDETLKANLIEKFTSELHESLKKINNFVL